MSYLDSFMSYELTHDDKKRSNNTGGGCLSGCATIIASFLSFIGIVTLFVIMVSN